MGIQINYKACSYSRKWQQK